MFQPNKPTLIFSPQQLQCQFLHTVGVPAVILWVTIYPGNPPPQIGWPRYIIYPPNRPVWWGAGLANGPPTGSPATYYTPHVPVRHPVVHFFHTFSPVVPTHVSSFLHRVGALQLVGFACSLLCACPVPCMFTSWQPSFASLLPLLFLPFSWFSALLAG